MNAEYAFNKFFIFSHFIYSVKRFLIFLLFIYIFEIIDENIVYELGKNQKGEGINQKVILNKKNAELMLKDMKNRNWIKMIEREGFESSGRKD